MQSKMLAGFLLGAWLAGTLFMWAVATQNFRLVDRLLASPSADFSARAKSLAPGDDRLLMRYQASESNRLFFSRWGWAQLGLAIVFAWLVFGGTGDRALRAAAVLMLLIVAAQQFYVVPETVRLGRLLDFASRDPAPPAAASFWPLHHAYTALDLLKFVLGLFSAARLTRF